jgi:PhnB protein
VRAGAVDCPSVPEHTPTRNTGFDKSGAMTETQKSGHVSVVPQLSVRRGQEAVEFYKRAFGAVEVYRVGGTDDHHDVVSQLMIGNAVFWVSDEAPASSNYSPESLGGGTVRMLIIVDDPAVWLERAKAAGAREVYPVAEEHGWRLGRVEDPYGHHWEIGVPLVPWPPAGGHPHHPTS